MAQIAQLPGGVRGEPVAFYFAECAGYAFGDVGAAVIGNDEAAARHQIDETLECDFDGFKIGVDVGVIELDMSEN